MLGSPELLKRRRNLGRRAERRGEERRGEERRGEERGGSIQREDTRDTY